MIVPLVCVARVASKASPDVFLLTFLVIIEGLFSTGSKATPDEFLLKLFVTMEGLFSTACVLKGDSLLYRPGNFLLSVNTLDLTSGRDEIVCESFFFNSLAIDCGGGGLQLLSWNQDIWNLANRSLKEGWFSTLQLKDKLDGTNDELIENRGCVFLKRN